MYVYLAIFCLFLCTPPTPTPSDQMIGSILSVCLSAHPPVYLSVYLSVCLSANINFVCDFYLYEVQRSYVEVIFFWSSILKIT